MAHDHSSVLDGHHRIEAVIRSGATIRVTWTEQRVLPLPGWPPPGESGHWW